MALNLDTAIRISANVQGGNQIQAFSRDIRNLETAAKVSSGDLGRMNIAINRMAREAGNTTTGLRQHISALQSLRDRVDINSNAYRRLGTEIDGLRSKLRGLDGDARRTGETLSRGGVGSALRGGGGAALGALATGGGVQGAAGALTGSMLASGSAAALAGAAGITAAGVLVSQAFTNAGALEDQSRKLRVMTDGAGQLQAGLASLVREQGYLVSATEAAAAAYDVLQAGFASNSEVLNIVRASALGATGGFTDMVVVADALTSILNGYGMSADAAGKIIDQMKAATDDGKISMEGYAQSIGRVVPSAVAAKVPLEEINAAISALTAQGVPVETTFSGINQAIKTILKPTKEAKELAAALGLEFNAQALAAKGLGGFLEDVSKKTGKSTDALSVLFSDIDGYKAVVGLLNDDLKRFNKFTDNQANAIGRASEAAKKGVDPARQLGNAWKDLTASLGKAFTPAFIVSVRTATAAISGAVSILDRYNKSRQELDQRSNAFADARKAVYGNGISPPEPMNDPAFRAEFNRRLAQAKARAEQANAPAPPRVPVSATAEQREAAARATAAARAMDDESAKNAADEAEKRRKDELDYQNDLFNIRLNFEKRLADFREQSLDRAKQMERDIGDQRLQLERSTDELRRRSEGQTQDFLLKLERDRLAAIGGDTSALDFEIEMTKVRRDASEQVIRNEQDAADRKLTLERSVENYRRTVAEGIRDITVDAGEQWADRVRKGATDAVATLGGATATGGGSAIFGSTGNVRNAPGWVHGHFQTNSGSLQSLMQDVLPVVRGLVSRGVPTELANGRRFTQGMSDAQIMSLLRQGAMLHSHSGDGRSIDIFVPQGTRVPGAVLDVRNTGGRGGVTGMLPGSGSSWVGHLDPRSRSGGGSVSAANNIRPTPTAARNLQAELRPASPLQPLNAAMLQVPGMDGINAATAGVLQASDAQRLAANALPPSEVLAKLGEQYGDITQELGQQQRSSRQQLEDYQRILTLQRSGLSPELAQQSVERARSAEREATQLQALENQTVQYLQQAGLTDKQRQTAQALLEATRERAIQLPDITANLDREAATLERLRDLEQQRQALIQGMANTIGGGLGSALDLLIEGTENWGNSLRGIASGVLKDIAKQLVQIYAVQPATKGLQGLLGNLFGGGNPAGAAAAAGAGASVYTMPMLSGVPAITGAFANGGIMTDQGPLPLRAYANGGVASTPQLALFGEGRRPEAYVPLPDGKRIPVALQIIDSTAQSYVAPSPAKPFEQSAQILNERAPSAASTFANGGIMTSAGPLPLRAYANGGIASGPQLALFGEGRRPEAYVPLPDGRRIPVAMQGGGGGGSVVNVTVNAEGSAVQGDSSRSEQLGQVVARAIQEEMIRQRRPGGLLAQ